MPPSQAEIARAFGFSGVRAAQYHLDALEAAGAIERVPGRARGIRLLRVPEAAQQALALQAAANGDVLELPVLGQVRSEEHTSELQSLMRISYADFCLQKK